jgi:hypothetical protein
MNYLVDLLLHIVLQRLFAEGKSKNSVLCSEPESPLTRAEPDFLPRIVSNASGVSGSGTMSTAYQLTNNNVGTEGNEK